MARFANTIDNQPIYAARAEADKDGNRIDTTYAKLADIPSVPVTDVEVNGTSVVSGGVAAVTVPTATSDLQNDSGFITLSDVPEQVNADWNSSAGASEILNKPTIPSGTQLVPAATSADADKVLTVNAQGVPGWAAGGGGSTYTAGDGIDITNNEISAKAGTGLEIGTTPRPVNTNVHAVGNPNGVTAMAAPLEPSVFNAIETTGITYTVQNLLDNNNVSQAWTYSDVSGLKIYPAICALAYDGDRKTYADTTSILVLSTTGIDVSNTSGSIPAGSQFVYNLNDINTTLSTIQWETIAADPNYTLCVVWPVSGGLSSLVANGDFINYRLYDSGTITAMEEVTGTLKVSNPLPASTSSDANKVLKVNASGEPEWATGGGGGGVNADWDETDPLEPSYIENKPTPKTLTAGANISISEGVGTLTISAAAGLPASTAADEGKCLVVDSNGDPEWGTGGKTYTGTDGVVVDNVNDTVGLEAPVDIVAGPGIAIDNPDGNTMRVSANSDSFFKELYYNATNTNDTAGKVYALSEPITNFMYAKITVDNMEFNNRPLVYEIDVQHNTTSCAWNSPLANGNVANTINLPVCQLQINASGNLVLVARGLTYNSYPSPQFTNGDSRGMRVVRVVGIFRIAGGN